MDNPRDNNEEYRMEDENLIFAINNLNPFSREFLNAIAELESHPNLSEQIIHRMQNRFNLTTRHSRENDSLLRIEDEIELPDPDPTNAHNFDTDLPAQHLYLGSNLSKVSAVNNLSVGKLYRMVLFRSQTLLLSGEILPMVIPYSRSEINFNKTCDCNLLGFFFPFTGNNDQIYGVTCQIYEKANDTYNNIILKLKIHQRFILERKDNPNFDVTSTGTYGNIRILSEIYLPDPLNCIQLGSLNRFRGISSMENSLKKFQASTTGFPSYIFEAYNIDKNLKKIKVYLEKFKLNSMPTDLVLLSFWLGRNLMLNNAELCELFVTNSVNARFQIIDKSLDNEKFFCCAKCEEKIANCNSLFAMSKDGVYANYLNLGLSLEGEMYGDRFEMNTVYDVIRQALYTVISPFTKSTWFPGYSWNKLKCRCCLQHLGWKYISATPTLIPKMFFGLIGTNIKN